MSQVNSADKIQDNMISHIVYCVYSSSTEVTEDFVQEFNKASTLPDKRRVNEKANKVLERTKVINGLLKLVAV